MQDDIKKFEDRIEKLESKVSQLESEVGTARRHALNVGSLAFRLAMLVAKPDAVALKTVLSDLEDYK